MKSNNLEKLLKRKDELDARIKLMQARDKSQFKKDETIRKILAGAYILEKYAAQNKKDILIQELDQYLFRPRDRSLFGLPPRTENDISNSELIES